MNNHSFLDNFFFTEAITAMASYDSKHGRIIRAALKVFAQKGFYNTKISEIAKEAEVADGTIYLYFKNKDDILISLFEEEVGKLIDRTEKELGKIDDPLEKLRKFAFLHLSIITSNRELAEVIQVELRQSGKFMRKYINKKFMDYLSIISEIIKEAQSLGMVKQDISPGIAKRAFFGALDEMTRYWVLSSSKRYTPENSAKQISEMFINGIKNTHAKL